MQTLKRALQLSFPVFTGERPCIVSSTMSLKVFPLCGEYEKILKRVEEYVVRAERLYPGYEFVVRGHDGFLAGQVPSGPLGFTQSDSFGGTPFAQGFTLEVSYCGFQISVERYPIPSGRFTWFKRYLRRFSSGEVMFWIKDVSSGTDRSKLCFYRNEAIYEVPSFKRDVLADVSNCEIVLA